MRKQFSSRKRIRSNPNGVTVSAFVDEAKPNALVRREAQFGEIELVELPAGVVDGSKVAVVDSDAVHHHRLRRRRDCRLFAGR